MIATSAGVAAPGIARAEATEIKALLITGGPLYPKYWEQITQDFKKKTGITVNYDLLEFTPAHFEDGHARRRAQQPL